MNRIKARKKLNPALRGTNIVMIYGTLLLVIVTILQAKMDPAVEEELRQPNRRSVFNSDDNVLPQQPNCSPASIVNFPDGVFTDLQRRQGYVAVVFVVAFYIFAAVAIVCDEYFMPALERICEVFSLSEDVAGATFMAMGGSAPELFVSIIGVFIAKGDIGVGTVVGSAVFNLLFVVGICGLFAGRDILLTCWPLMRDSLCYVLTVIALIVVVHDSYVSWGDALLLMGIYCGYLVFMYLNPKAERKITKFSDRMCKNSSYKKSYDKERKRGEKDDLLLASSSDEEENDLFLREKTPPEINGPSKFSKNEDDTCCDPLVPPKRAFELIPWLLVLPIHLIFYITIPNCEKPNWRSFYPVTFLNSLLWIGALTYILVWMVTVIGDTLQINDTIMGLTFMAAGASTPDTILSVIAAREGYGDMAVSHSIGSNIFDITMGLGLPWFIKTVMIDLGSTVPIYSGAIYYITALLLANVVVLITLIAMARFKLNVFLGLMLLLFYFAFLASSILFEMNIFVPGLTLPVCPFKVNINV